MLPEAFSMEILIFSYGLESFSQTFPQGFDKVTLKIIIFSRIFFTVKSSVYNIMTDSSRITLKNNSNVSKLSEKKV